MTTDYDIIIAGGGLAGQIASIALGQQGHKILCLDPMPPQTKAGEFADYRATALLGPSVDFLTELGIWEPLFDHAMAMSQMRIVDIGGEDYAIRYDAPFEASDIGLNAFGQSVLNWRFAEVLGERISNLPNVEFRKGAKLVDFIQQSSKISARSDQGQISAKLLIGADGRGSFVRNHLAIKTKTTRYAQTALNFVVAHEIPHEGASIELHRSGGPFTFVPLPVEGTQNLSSVVWMDHNEDAIRRKALDPAAFIREAQIRSGGILRDLTLKSPIGSWPMIAQYAQNLTDERVALIAEAAHTIPPIGAQGLNMSLMDIKILAEQLNQYGCESPTALRNYEQKRLPDIKTRIRGVDLLNRAAMANHKSLRDLRVQGLRLLHQVKPIRNTLMRRGLGAA